MNPASSVSSFLLALIPCLLLTSCLNDELAPLCPDKQAAALPGGSCLRFNDGSQLNAFEPQIEEIIRQAVGTVYELFPEATRIGIEVEAGTDGIIPEYGFAGYAGLDNILLIVNPGFADLEQSLDEELYPVMLHELHHILRHRSQGFAPDLFSFFLNEGLADHFSTEIAGTGPPIWSTALQGQELDEWIAEARQVWFDPPDNVADWLFGTTEIPRWTAYSIGYELVRCYLEEHPGLRSSDLIDEPANSFLLK